MWSWTKSGRRHRRPLALAQLGLFAGAAAAAVLSFPVPVGAVTLTLRGFMTEGADVWLSLRVEETGIQRWVRVGGNLGDYQVERWNLNGRTATLRRGGASIDIPLVAGTAELGPDLANASEVSGVVKNVARLTASACQQMIVDEIDSVGVEDLMGPEKGLRRIESVAGESYAGIFFTVTRAGVQMVVDGKTVPVLPGSSQIIIQAGPTQSLAAISRRLEIPLRKLVALNPGLPADGRISAWTSIRLQ